MPEIGAGEYLLEAWNEIGRYRQDGNIGLVPLSWQEINAYCEGHPIITEHWERHVLFDLSAAYIRGLRHGENPLAMSPMDLINEKLDQAASAL